MKEKKFFNQLIALVPTIVVLITAVPIQVIADDSSDKACNKIQYDVEVVSGGAIDVGVDLTISESDDEQEIEFNKIDNEIKNDEEVINDENFYIADTVKLNIDEKIGMLIWEEFSGSDLTFTSNGDVSKFIEIEVDDEVLSSNDFDVLQQTFDVIKYRLNKEYLDGLDYGYHDVLIIYDNCTVDIQLAVVKNIEDFEIELLSTDTTWQEDWEYNIQTGTGIDGEDLISITKYKGSSQSWIIPDKATIGGVDYKTCININTPVRDIISITIDGSPYCESLFFTQGISENNTLKSFIAPTLDMRKYGNYKMFKGCKVLETFDIANWNTVGVSSINGWFQDCSSLKNIDISGWDITQVTTMSYLFYWCENLETITLPDMSNLKVNSTTSMFEGCCKLSNFDISDFDFSNVDNASNMFSGCYSIIDLDVSEWDTSSLVNASDMFSVRADDKCQLSILDVSNWDVHNLSVANNMFSGLINVTSLDVSNWNTGSLTEVRSMFQNLRLVSILDVSEWDVSNVINMSAMFQYCSSLKSLDLSKWNTSNVSSMTSMFAGTGVELLDVSKWDVSNVTNMKYMFGGSSITKLDLTSWNVSKVTDMSLMFSSCSKLKSLDIAGWNVSSLKNIDDMFIGLNSMVELDLSTLDFSNVNPHNISNNNRRFISGVHKIITPSASVSGVVLYHESGGDITFYGYDSSSKKYTDLYSELPLSSKVLYIGEDKWNITQHIFGQRNIIKQPTSTSTGIAEDSCEVCDLVLAVELPKLEVPAGSYIVEFESNTDTQVEAQIVVSGQKATEPTGLMKAGKVIDGWYTDSSCTNQWIFNNTVTSNLKLYAKWADKYTVSFNDGTSTTTQDVIQGHKVTKPTNPTKTGHTFTGWFKEQSYTTEWDFNNPVESDMTLYAKFNKNTYTVTFDTGGTQDVQYGDKIINPVDPTKKGHTFKGWFKDEELTDEWDFNNDVVEDTMTLYAKFDINRYSVTFDTGAGSAVTNQTIQYGQKVTKPTTPTYIGHVLKGWFTDNTYTTAWDFNSDVVEDTMTLYAKWVAGFNIILIDSVDDSTIDILGVEDGDVESQPADPEHNGYTFKGWYTMKDGTIEYDWTQVVTAHETVYAQWYKNPEVRLLDYSDGSLLDIINIGYNTKLIESAITSTKSDEILLGYYTDDTSVAGDNKFDFDSAITVDIDIYCLFAEKVDYTAYGVDTEGNESDMVIAKDSLFMESINGDNTYMVEEQGGKGYDILPEDEVIIEVFNSGLDGDKKWQINEWLQDATGTPAEYKVVTGSAIDMVYVSDDNFPDDNTIYASVSYKYKVKFNVLGDITEEWVDSNEKIIKKTVDVGEGKHIDGWFKDAEFNSAWNFDSDVVISPMILYAKVINDAGEVVTQPSETPEIPSNPTIPSNPLGGWSSSSGGGSSSSYPSGGGGGGSYYPSTTPTGTSTPQQTIKIKAVVDGEKYDDLKVSVVDGKIVIVTPIKDGYEFNGWFNDDGLTDKIDIESLDPYKEVTIYGEFKELVKPVELFKVSLNNDVGDVVNTLTVISGQSIYQHVEDIIAVDNLDMTVNEYLLQGFNNTAENLLGWYMDGVVYDITKPVEYNLSLIPMFKKDEVSSAIKVNQLIHLKALNTGKQQITLKWNQVKGAKYYVIYGSKCGRDLTIIGYANISNSKSKDKLLYTLKKMNKNTWYKFKVIAYKKNPFSKQHTLLKSVKAVSKSLVVHTVTTGGKYTNVKAVVLKLNQKNVTLQNGQALTIVATTILNKKNRKTKYHCAKIRLKSNNDVVKIKNKTTIVAKKKGICTVFVYAQNGKYKKIKVTVK